MSNAADTRTFNRIYDICDPWVAATTEREEWLVTLPSGATVTLWAPLGAAVEVEEAGYQIAAAPTRVPAQGCWA
jgi:hypothetical protein